MDLPNSYKNNPDPNIKLQNFLITSNKIRVLEEKTMNEKKNDNQDSSVKLLVYLMRIVSIDSSEKNAFFRRVRALLLTAFILYTSYWSITGRMTYVYTHIPNIVKITDISGLIVNGAVCIYNILTGSFSKIDDYNKSILKCCLIDELLEVEIHTLRKIEREWIFKFIMIVLTILALMCSYDFFTWTTSYDYDHSTKYVLNYLFYFINTLMICHFIIRLHNLWGKFHILNEYLELYSEVRSSALKEKYIMMKSKESWGIINALTNYNKYHKLSVKSFNINNCSIDKLMKVYMLACDMADSCNHYFGVQMLLAALSSIISILRSLRITVLFAEGEAGLSDSASAIFPLLTTLLESVYVIFILLLIISSCDFTTQEAKRTSLILDTLLYNTCSESSKDTQKLEAWSQLMVRRSPKFTACEMFPIDYQLLVTIAGTVVTYFIIIVQIKN